MEEQQSPKNKKPFFNTTNIIIIITLVVAFTILAYQFDDDPLPQPTVIENENSKQSDNSVSQELISSGNPGTEAIGEVTTLHYDAETSIITFVGFVYNGSDRKQMYTTKYYYNQTYLGSSEANIPELPGCDECANHVFEAEFTHDISEFDSQFAQAFAVHNIVTFLLPINENATSFLE